MGIYAPEELMTVNQYLTSLYGDRIPAREEEESWKLSEIEMYNKSAIFAISNYFRIPGKDDQLTLMRPFAMQAILDLCIEAQRREGLRQRVAIFKSRQVGGSSWMLARSVHATSSEENKNAMFLVPDEDVCNKMAIRMASMINNLPRFLQAMKRIHNMKHVVFDNPNPKDRSENPGLNSAIQITVPSSMRGIPPRILTVSEYSHMEERDQFAISSSILPAMGDSEHTCAVIDTTPNGYDEFYHPLIMEACKANKKWIKRLEDSPRPYNAQEILGGAIGIPENLYEAEWLVAFEPWHWHEEYTIKDAAHPRGQSKKPPAPIWREFMASIGKVDVYGGEEEMDLMKRHGVTPEQLYWRRRTIKSYKMPTDEMRLATFHQEFAMSIEGGFIELTKNPFDRSAMDALVRMRKDPLGTGLLKRREDGVIGCARSMGSPWHQWRIYDTPESNEKYCMGIDTAEAYESTEADFSACAVMRYRDRKVVAVYIAKVPEHIMREQLFLAYQWYGRAYMGIETKGMGYRLVRTLIAMGVQNYYSWKRTDKAMPEPTEFPGWQTDDRTRPLMDNTFIEHLCARNPETGKAEPSLIIEDWDAIKQIQGIRRGDSGSLKHAHGKDDLFDAITICLCLIDDPWGGGYIKRKEADEREKRYEFESLFSASMPHGPTIRSRPTLASL